ncbi:MAG: MarR family winged helix-turn-helix transcriptional regulator [Acidothermaceae bacterium]
MADEIDRVSARLHTQRPSLDTATLALSDRVIRLARHLDAGRRDALAARELEVWEYDVLLALRAAESAVGLSPSGLMAATQVASATMTNRVDRLGRRGFVSREPDPADHRGVLVRLTPAGRRRVEQAATDVAAAESGLWGGLPERRQTQLTAALRELLGALD